MSGDGDDGAPKRDGEGARTPAAGADGPTVYQFAKSAGSADADPAADRPRPKRKPIVPEPSGAAPAASRKPRAATPEPAPAAEDTRANPSTHENARGIKVGDILHHTYVVKRFVARGGMGEVFEGVNRITEERIAIKGMLPALVADERVLGMFHREAKILTRLRHDALIHYRAIQQEPDLGIPYIISDYIDGPKLSDVIGAPVPDAAQCLLLLRRLADGLSHAHGLGAVHRDLSPDNILLENGALAHAKIIDFGIAKDVLPGSGTILDGDFAGRFEYASPEQLGEFGGEVGPPSDVYSLGLVMLAVATGRKPRMGGGLVEAIRKRLKGPDLSEVPETLRPIFAKMLVADPKDRLASMSAVLQALERPGAGRGFKGSPLLLGGAGAALALLLAAGWWLSQPAAPVASDTGTTLRTAPSPVPPPPPRPDTVSAARTAVNASLAGIECSWLDIVDIGSGEAGTVVRLVGVAQNPAAAQETLSRALAGRGLRNTDLDFADVGRIEPSGCFALDAYRQVRSPETPRITSPQRRFEMRRQEEGARYKGQLAANLIYELNIGDPASAIALVGFEAPGSWKLMIPDREALLLRVAQSVDGRPLANLGGDRYRVNLDVSSAGWTGMLLLTGPGPMDRAVISPEGVRDQKAWRDRFVTEAKARGWQADMLWVDVVAPR